MTIEYITILVYFVILLALGMIFSRFNKNLSDFARGGTQGTWWMVGTSMLMGGISAFTFTGNASAAFEAGPSLLIVYGANILGLVFGWLLLGRWFRQTRAYTGADVVRDRFGTPTEQFSAYVGIILGPLNAATQLFALSIFISSVFGISLPLCIIAIGFIVLFYSSSGGMWAVMATDVVQGIILFSITILVAFLAIKEIGGVGEFFSYFSHPDIVEDFKFVKAPGAFSGNKFTVHWMIVIFIMQFINFIHLGTSTKYLSAKDGREASRAGLWALVLMIFGSSIWFIPPMVARFLYEDQVMGMAIREPATASYAVAAMNLLPTGLLGVMIASMFSATMSSMDTGLNAQTSIIVRNIIPRFRSLFGRGEMTDKTNLILCRIISSLLGIWIIIAGLLLSRCEDIALFDIFFIIGSVIGIPMGLPLVVGLFVRRLPSWAYFFIMGCSTLPVLYSMICGVDWTYQTRSSWILGFGLAASIVSSLLAKRCTSKDQKAREIEFFKRMNTPIDFEKEVGASQDERQTKVMANIIMVMGGLLMLFQLLPNGISDRLIILALSAFIFGIGLLLWTAAHRTEKRNRAKSDLQ